MTAISEANALEAALEALDRPPEPTHIASLSRTVIRAADDLELVAEETANRATRKTLLTHVAHARMAVTAARKAARQAALKVDRTQLLDVPEPSKREPESDTAKVARQINDSLRRTTAIVSEEVDRSRAAGNVIDESTRRLRITRDQHGRYGEGLSSGADTLKSIRRSEMVANFLIVLSFAIFFLAAAYVTKRRLANSNISTFVLRPGFTVASLPVRVLGWMVRSLGITRLKAIEIDPEKVSPAQGADEAQKAKEGRVEMETVREHEENVKIGTGEGAKETAGPNEGSRSCDANQKCASGENDQSDQRNEEETNDTQNSSNDSNAVRDQDTTEDMEINDVEEGSGTTREDLVPGNEEVNTRRSHSPDFESIEDGDTLGETDGDDVSQHMDDGVTQQIDDDARSEGEGHLDSELNRSEKDTEQATASAGQAKE